MRNIYDIIAEQKVLVDCDMSLYEMQYMYNQLLDKEYVEEGLSDIGKKIVDFIKKIIEKIRQMIKKFVSFFTGSSSNLEASLNKKIEQANKQNDGEAPAPAGGGGGGDGSSSGYKEPPSKEYGPNVKLDDLYGILERCTLTFKIPVYADFNTRVSKFEDVYNAYDAAFNQGLELLSKETPNGKKLFMKNYFPYSVDENENLAHALEERVGDVLSMSREIRVYKIADDIYDYIHLGREAAKKFADVGDNIEKELQDLIRQASSSNGAWEVDSRSSTFFQSLSTTVAVAVNYFVTSALEAYKTYANICIKVTDSYCDAQKIVKEVKRRRENNA